MMIPYLFGRFSYKLNLSMIEQFTLFPDTKREKALDKASLGQFFTPPEIAVFMAGLFRESEGPISLLDPGSGQGVLTHAILKRFPNPQRITLIERDPALITGLKANFAHGPIDISILNDDFIRIGTCWHRAGKRPFSHIIMNPPYRKISSSSSERKNLRIAGIETVNLYSGFVALGLSLLKPHGELVAIIPRSFCNGPYYRSFRRFLTAHSAVRRIHLFTSRTSLFNYDKVLQENVIIHLERDVEQGDVIISSSTDQSFADLAISTHPFESIIDLSSEEAFIRFPEDTSDQSLTGAAFFRQGLPVNVSTGPVVEFRMRDYLRKMPQEGDAPLLYPAHFNKGFLWPRPDFRKYNSISVCASTIRSLYPNGWYVVTRRLSSKEEKKRIVANVVDPNNFQGSKYLAFENHLNVFHENREGLDEYLALGLAAYLNSPQVDRIFRTFSGNTQVNATDLRNLPYPGIDRLYSLGKEWRSVPKERLNEWLTETLS